MLDDVDKMEKYIREAQVSDIRSFLGDELYLKMILDFNEETRVFATQRYTDLWDGIDYTVGTVTKRSHGLKAAHVYYTVARIIEGNWFTITRFGPKDLQSDNSTTQSTAMIRAKVNTNRSQGLIYQNEAKMFLEQNNSDYTEWPDGLNRPIKTGIKMFKV